MARSRKYGEDLTYAEWHRSALPKLYGRIGHRLDLANRDWTEYCHYCKKPLALIEEVRDVGQDLLDKGVSVTRNLARLAGGMDAWMLGVRIDRPREVDDEIDRLNRQIRQLEAEWPITGFTVRDLRRRGLTKVSTDEWLEKILITHRQHHLTCAQAREFPVKAGKLLSVKEAHPLHELNLFDGLTG